MYIVNNSCLPSMLLYRRTHGWGIYLCSKYTSLYLLSFIYGFYFGVIIIVLTVLLLKDLSLCINMHVSILMLHVDLFEKWITCAQLQGTEVCHLNYYKNYIANYAWQNQYQIPFQPETPISTRGPKARGLIMVEGWCGIWYRFLHVLLF